MTRGQRGRHAVKVAEPVAAYYRDQARRRDRRISLILLEELEAAIADIDAGRGGTLPPAPGPGRRKRGTAESDGLVQMKWTQDQAGYALYCAKLREVGSSPTAVLRAPRDMRTSDLSV